MPSWLPPDGLLCCIGAFQVCFIPMQSDSRLSLGVFPKTGSPSTSCQGPGHRGVSVNSSPTKCSCRCFVGCCISNPCQMRQATAYRAHCWCNFIFHWQAGHKWLQNGVFRPKDAQGAPSGLWWSDKEAKAQMVASGSGSNLAPE